MNLKLVKLQLLASGLLTLILGAEWGYGEIAGRNLRESLQYTNDESNTSTELPAIADLNSATVDYGDLVERPLFIEGRKPIAEANFADNAKNVETGQIDDWSLIGVYNKDKRPLALFTKKNETKKYLKIGVEQMISGWTLKEIQSDRVVLQQMGQEKSVLLRKPRAESKSPVPGRPAAPAKPPKPPKPVVQPTNTNPENANDDSQTN